MRNAAMVLGIIAGIVGMVIGFFAYGFAVLGEAWDTFAQTAVQAGVGQVIEDPLTSKVVGLLAPILAITGGAMAPSRPAIGAVLMIVSALGMYHGLDFNVFTMFPIAMSGLGGLLALGGALARGEAA